MSYRNAKAADLPAIDAVFRQSFCDTFAHLYEPDDLASFLAKFTSEAWAHEFNDPGYSFRIAEADGQVVGFVKVGPSTLPIDDHASTIELRQLYILSRYHGAGIAHALMDWALEESRRRGAREIYLTVYTDNHRAKRFYDRYGFEPVGRYDFMVGNHVDEDIIMRKRV